MVKALDCRPRSAVCKLADAAESQSRLSDGRSEPGGQGVAKALVRAVSNPCDVPVGSNQHGSGSGDRAEHRELPPTIVSGVDSGDPIRPWSNVEGAGLTE